MHGQGSRLLGLHGVVVTNVGEAGDQLDLQVELIARAERCPRCGRGPVMVKDRPVVASDMPAGQGAGYVHAFARPVALDQGLWERVTAKLGGRQAIHQALLDRVQATKLGPTGYGPSLLSANYWERRGADEWRLATRDADERGMTTQITNLVELRVSLDGRGHLFCGRATDGRSDGDAPVIIEVVIAGNLEAFFAVMGMFYEAAGYHGHVDVGVAVTGLQGAVSFKAARSHGFHTKVPYSAPTFTRTARIAAAANPVPKMILAVWVWVESLIVLPESGFGCQPLLLDEDHRLRISRTKTQISRHDDVEEEGQAAVRLGHADFPLIEGLLTHRAALRSHWGCA